MEMTTTVAITEKVTTMMEATTEDWMEEVEEEEMERIIGEREELYYDLSGCGTLRIGYGCVAG